MKYTFVILLLFAITTLSAQIAPDKYFVRFTDKLNTNYSIEEPQEFLSERAISRRLNHDIEIDIYDLPVSKYYVDSLISLGVEILYSSKWLNGTVITTTDSSLLDTITKISFINHVSIYSSNEKRRLKKSYEKDTTNPYFGERYGVFTDQILMHNGQVLHNSLYKGENMLIGVIDGGFDRTDELRGFDSLFSNDQIIATKDFVDFEQDVYDDHFHGTNVLSLMAGEIPGELMGTAPNADYVLLRSEDVATEYIIEEYNWIVAAEFADSIGCDIINTSLGYSDFDNKQQNHIREDLDGNTTPIAIGADIAASRGMLMVISAGNEGNKPWYYNTTPADADSALVVGAVDINGTYMAFSSKGPSYDGDIKPDVVAMGYGAYVMNVNNDVIPATGTSFAAPIICGLAACLWQANPELSNIEIINLIRESSNNYHSPDSLVGYGIPNFAKALFVAKGFSPTDLSKDQILQVKPNPFENSIEVYYYSVAEQLIELEMYDLFGRAISSENHYVGEFSYNSFLIYNLESLKSGMYIINISAGDSNYQQKVIKVYE